jgi:PAS domain S-box-containing protein
MTLPPPDSDTRNAPRVGGWTLPACVLAGGLAVTLALAAWSVHTNAGERQARFERRVETFRQLLVTRTQSHIDTIPGLRLAASGPRPLTDIEFSRYVETVALTERFPSMALSFVADLVPDAQRDAYVASVRAASPGQAAFDIQPPGRRPLYMVLRHQQPGDPGSTGYDLFDPTRPYRPMVEAAIDSGGYVATGPLKLARDRDRPDDPALTSIVVRAATYRDGVVPDTLAARRARVSGAVGIAFRTMQLARGALPPELGDGAHVRIVDVQAQLAGQPALLFDNRKDIPASAAGTLAQDVRVADRTWRLEATPSPHAAWNDADLTTWVLLVTGLVTSLSLAAMTRALTRANAIAEARIREGLAQVEADRYELALSEGRFRMLFEHSLDAVLRTRPDGSILAANPAACAMFGMPESELIAHGRERVVDMTDARAHELVARRARQGQARGRIRMFRADGSAFEAEVSSMIYSDTGETSASVVVRDLSDMLREASERQRLESQLRHAQKMEAVGMLAGGIAHDFNNVLAVVLGNTAMAAQDLGPGHPAAANLERVRQASLRARTLVQQLLTFSRPPTENRRVQLLRPLVEEALALLRSTLPATVEMRVRLTEAPLPVLTDTTQVQQVVINLCSNAWQALPQHKGRIEVTLEAVSCDPAHPGLDGLENARPCARLRVRDDGIGMDEATRGRIFEPFFTTKDQGEGTGLGLAMVHGIVTGHGGAIVVDSQPGAGATFDILLPLADVDAAGDRALGDDDGPDGSTQPAAPPARGRGQHVMYVDDDEVVSLTAEALLLREGYRVQTHVDPAAAIAALQADPGGFDLVVTDYNMPQMSGLDVAAAVRAMRDDLPVVITSGRVSEELVEGARALGVARVMLKEYIVEQLGGLAGELLAGSDEGEAVV